MASRRDDDSGPVVTVRRMDEYDRDVRDEVTRVILDGYFSELSFFSRDRHGFAAALRDDLRADMFHVAEVDGAIVSVLACSDHTGRALVANRASFRRGLGHLRGTVAARLLAREFNAPQAGDAHTGYIEWVATSEHARGRGVSTALFRHVMRHTHHRTLTLEVVDSNHTARRLYARLGFVEYARRPAKVWERRMFQARLYLRWSKDPVPPPAT
ncbi:GNAT family N-acetyltransferase [Streptomyces sp. DSM 44915]|uniref:GNAT family N-acetyltransferase n=1 Tax=Streptomyces chisholmiae TaxID=3075540 RepID=A0ABU2JSG3_9ACTN|nr:GNAT family N-acetyltransferase [Streptomyces sp. DSM 44915]MDT0267925.1 GNAT family N-acetyltransferase [Streptomyces sp. DSM 44915]